MKPTDRNGQFAVTWMDLNTDYEIYAEKGGSVSEKLLIPSSAKRREILIELRLEKKAK